MQSPWWRGRLCAFDLETTGTDVFQAHVVTATVAYVGGGRDGFTLNWLVNPGVPIPEEAARIHGVTNERAEAEGSEPVLALTEISTALVIAIGEGYPIVAFNASYDLSLLVSELRRRGFESQLEVRLAGAHIIDPLTIDKGVNPKIFGKGKRVLSEVCRRYGVELDNAHNSAADALAAARLAYKMAVKHRLDDLAELRQRQAEWHSIWATNFAHYLRREGKNADDVDPNGWPLRRPKLTEVTA